MQGAGKTTLMDVIAGRKTVGRITGDIMVNGKPKEQATWARQVGYVEQVIGNYLSKLFLSCCCNCSVRITYLLITSS